MVTVGILILALFYMGFTGFNGRAKRGGSSSWGTTGSLVLFLTVTLWLGWYFGWDSLSPRLEQIGEGYQGREEMYVAAQPMAQEYPIFGTGPGTFATVFQLYRYSNETYWPEQLHNDWLETRITFGWLGFALLLAALGCVATAGFFAPKKFAVMAGLALAGCLIHARFDFPLQIHSVLFLFLVICALLLALGVMPRRN